MLRDFIQGYHMLESWRANCLNDAMDYTTRNFTDLHKMSRISKFSGISGPNLNLTSEMTKMKYKRLKGLEACIISFTWISLSCRNSSRGNLSSCSFNRNQVLVSQWAHWAHCIRLWWFITAEAWWLAQDVKDLQTRENWRTEPPLHSEDDLGDRVEGMEIFGSS